MNRDHMMGMKNHPAANCIDDNRKAAEFPLGIPNRKFDEHYKANQKGGEKLMAIVQFNAVDHAYVSEDVGNGARIIHKVRAEDCAQKRTPIAATPVYGMAHQFLHIDGAGLLTWDSPVGSVAIDTPLAELKSGRSSTAPEVVSSDDRPPKWVPWNDIL